MNDSVNNIMPYNVSSHDIWEMSGNERNKCLKLDWNEATVPPSPKVYNRIKELAINGDFYQWYPSTSNLKLISAISKYMDISKENIQVFASSDTLQEYIARCWLTHGDKVLILWPTYDNFRVSVEIVGAEIIYSLMPNLKFNAEQLQKDIDTNAPQMVYICNPNNPTGEQIETDVIRDIIKRNSSVLFLIDEAYAEFSGKTVVDLTGIYENLLVSRTFSKAFALANFRIGYLISSRNNIATISKVRNAKNVTTFSQEAAVAALEDIEYMMRYVKNVRIAREFFFNKMKEYFGLLSVYPSEANFMLVRLLDSKMKHEFLNYMKNNKVYIRDLCQDVLSECFVRITIGTVEQMKFVIEKIREFEVLYHESSNI